MSILSDYDLAEVREYRFIEGWLVPGDTPGTTIAFVEKDAADAAITALYEKWQEALAERDELRQRVKEYEEDYARMMKRANFWQARAEDALGAERV